MTRGAAAARRAPGSEAEKVLIPRRCSVAEYSFAAHVDGVENREFIEEVAAPVVILVHGEQHNMMRLKSKLLSLNASKTNKVKVYSPRNCEELRIPFKTDKTAKVVGKLATVPPPAAMSGNGAEAADAAPLMTGVLVQNDFKLSLMAPEDLREYAGLNTTTILCRQRLRLSAAGIDLIRWALEGTFGAVEELPEMRKPGNGSSKSDDAIMQDADADVKADEESKEEDEEEKHGADADAAKKRAKVEEVDGQVATLVVAAYLVMGCITVRYRSNGEVELEWEGNMLNDSIADSVMAVLFSVESSPAAVRRSSAKHSHSHSHSHSYSHSNDLPLPAGRNPHAACPPAERLERLFWFLEAQFGADNVCPVDTPRLPPQADDDDDEAKKEEEEQGKGQGSGSDGVMKKERIEQRDGHGENGDDANGPKKEDDDEAAAEQQDESNPNPNPKNKTSTPTPPPTLEERQRAEVDRLHRLGIPVPGVRISVDRMQATVWLEDLDVECGNKVFADRVRAVMERAVEVTAPLWA